MPDYRLPKVLARFTAGKKLRGASSPAKSVPPSKGPPNLAATPSDSASSVSAAQKQFIMEVNGCMPYYARDINHLMLPACRDISIVQSRPTQGTLDAC